jgi:hypothetical protein
VYCFLTVTGLVVIYVVVSSAPFRTCVDMVFGGQKITEFCPVVTPSIAISHYRIDSYVLCGTYESFFLRSA